ncbi:hypothetical protein NMY22_g9001 [Coprinellus aureogranulatus]|nr:hypothetical protein NMY22_g9001 [Coprinellus aureogranulatus]
MQADPHQLWLSGVIPSTSQGNVMSSINATFRSHNCSIWMHGGANTYNGWMLLTTEVPTATDLEIVHGWVLHYYGMPPHAFTDTMCLIVSLPMLTSYLKLIGLILSANPATALRLKHSSISGTLSPALAWPPSSARPSSSTTACAPSLGVPSVSAAANGVTLLLPARAVFAAASVATIVSTHPAARVVRIIRQTLLLLPLLTSRAPTRVAAPTVVKRATALSTTNACSGVRVLTAPRSMLSPPSSTKDIREIRICTFNIAKNFHDLDVFLKHNVNDFDVLFIQELPWQLIRHAPSARLAPMRPAYHRELIDDCDVMVISLPQSTLTFLTFSNPKRTRGTRLREPIHLLEANPGARVMLWDLPTTARVLLHEGVQPRATLRNIGDSSGTTMEGSGAPGYREKFLSFAISFHAPAILCVLIEDTNIFVTSDYNSIELIAGRIESLPQMTIMGGDFNCHSSEWDPAVQHHRTTPILLVDTAAQLGLEYAPPSNLGPTFVSRADLNVRSVIDLTFLPPGDVIAGAPERATNLQGELDHVPLTTLLPLDQVTHQHKGRTIKGGSDEEAAFILQIKTGLAALLHEVYSKGYTITVKSKPWWGKTCQEAYDEYREDNSPNTRCTFWAAVKAAKWEFFDEKVTEISIDHKRPWDLMAWIQERKNPPCKAIQFKPCHTTDQLWQALHGTYNTANN